MEFFYYLVKIAVITLQIVNEFDPSPESDLVVPGTHLTNPWIKVDQVGSNRIKVVLIGFNGINLLQLERNLIKQIGFNWFKLVEFGFKFDQFGYN